VASDRAIEGPLDPRQNHARPIAISFHRHTACSQGRRPAHHRGRPLQRRPFLRPVNAGWQWCVAHPHARIRSVDFSKARTTPGVLGTYSGADCLADKLKPIPHDPLPKTKYDMKLHAPGGGVVFIGPHMLLPGRQARHVGEAVAAVVAETQAQALDAAEAVYGRV